MQNRWPFICSVLPNRHFLPVLRLCKCLGGSLWVWDFCVAVCCERLLCTVCFLLLGKNSEVAAGPGLICNLGH